jgi:hypothetical protein
MNIKILLVAMPFLLLACSIQKTSNLTTENIKPGMTKTEVTSLHGKPYKESFNYDINKVLHEDLYYKENVYVNKWLEITSVLHFEDSKLVSMEQEKERPVYMENNKKPQ